MLIIITFFVKLINKKVSDYHIIKRTNYIFLGLAALVVVMFLFINRNQGVSNTTIIPGDLDGSYIVSYGLLNKKNYIAPVEAEQIIKETAALTVRALKFKNFVLLRQVIHPNFGVRISPYAYVMSSDVILTSDKIENYYNENREIVWGYDINMQSLSMNFRDYYSRFIYSNDYLLSEKITYNQPTNNSGIIDNSLSYYPNAITVEYQVNSHRHADKDSKNYYRLIFEEYDDVWYLSGIINISKLDILGNG